MEQKSCKRQSLQFCLLLPNILSHSRGTSQTYWRRHTADREVLSTENHRASWDLLCTASRDVLACAEWNPMWCHCCYCVRNRDGALMELLGKKNKIIAVWIRHQLLKIKIWAFIDFPLRCIDFSQCTCPTSFNQNILCHSVRKLFQE